MSFEVLTCLASFLMQWVWLCLLFTISCFSAGVITQNNLLFRNSGSATGELGHYGSHPCAQVADRGTPSRMDKRVAPDKEGAADKQCL